MHYSMFLYRYLNYSKTTKKRLNVFYSYLGYSKTTQKLLKNYSKTTPCKNYSKTTQKLLRVEQTNYSKTTPKLLQNYSKTSLRNYSKTTPCVRRFVEYVKKLLRASGHVLTM